MEYALSFLAGFGGAVLGSFLATRFKVVVPKEAAPTVKRAPVYNTPAKAATYLKGVEDGARVPSTWMRP